MNYKYLNELERNLEIQAHSYLLQKDESLFESQTRTEFNQLSLTNRLKSHSGQLKKFYLSDISLGAKILEICAEHILVEQEGYKYLININHILGVNNLSYSNSKLTRFEERWNLKSSLRDLMFRKTPIHIRLINEQHFQGTLENFFNDHFDLLTNIETISLLFNSVSWVKYKGEPETVFE